MLQVIVQVAVEEGLALLREPHAHVELGARLLRHEPAQEGDIGGGDFHVDEEIGAREGEQHQHLVLAHEQRIEIQLAALVLQDRHRERQLAVRVDQPPDDVGALVAEEERIEHLDLQVGPGARGAREMLAQRAHDVAQVARTVLPWIFQVEASGDRPQGLPEAVLQGVIGAIRRRLALEVLGRDRRPPEDELVVIVAPVQHLAGHRVIEGLGALGLLVLVQQPDVRELDRRPERLVHLGLGIAVEQGPDRLLDAPVVHQDALAGERAHLRPGGALEERLRLGGGLPEERVVLVEAGQDGASHLLREGAAPLLELGYFLGCAHLKRLAWPSLSRRRTARLPSSRAGRWSKPCPRSRPG